MCDDELCHAKKNRLLKTCLSMDGASKRYHVGPCFNGATNAIAPILASCLALGAEVQAQAITLLQTNEEARLEEIQR